MFGKRYGSSKTSLFGKISQNCLDKMTTIIHRLRKMHTPSYKAVSCLPRYLTMSHFFLRVFVEKVMDLPKQGFRQCFAPSSLKCMPRSEEEYSEGEMSFVVLSEILYIICWHWFMVLVKLKIHLENGTIVQVLKPVIKGHLELLATCCLCTQTFIRWHGSVPWISVYLSMVLFFLFVDHMCKEYIFQNEKNHNGHQV